MHKFSIVIPVYNRPEEVDELLQSLVEQTYKNFEVVLIEDGSAQRCESIADRYRNDLDVHYYFKENSGQGFSRNYGYEKANGDFFVVFDSDCIIPRNYLEIVEKNITDRHLDAYGGPDKAHTSFTALQKAISYSMTSFFTTGGIRGGKKRVGQFHPRSFNMGISRKVFEATQGYKITRMGEDIELSLRIIEKGFDVGLIEEAYVYHKRRTSLTQFWKQVFFFGRARINITRFYPNELKLVHALPACFTLAVLFYLSTAFFSPFLFHLGSVCLGTYTLLLFIDSLLKNKNLKVALLSIPAGFVQILGYGSGFITEALGLHKKP